MNNELTVPQQRVLDYVTEKGEAEEAVLKSRGLDVRAANNLVKKRVLTLTNGVYRLRSQKVAKTEEKAAKAEEKAESAATVEGKAEAAKGEAKAEKAKKPAKVVEVRHCLCGCGAQCKSRFLPGHDARLHSAVLRVHRGKGSRDEVPEAAETLSYLKGAPWMTPEIAKSVGLELNDRQASLFA